ncbi:hypothetical protein Lalb_Chr10g0102031 [Lupinus albus]|uniref:Uncharacterized protein n=1 Tax=Lupinus albus TaxID=3870 RepID=A0A6A4PX59_LUPAL|nr:hypothetical protein Lalb_Chr10g0102031 [Lupinus albus]
MINHHSSPEIIERRVQNKTVGSFNVKSKLLLFIGSFCLILFTLKGIEMMMKTSYYTPHCMI